MSFRSRPLEPDIVIPPPTPPTTTYTNGDPLVPGVYPGGGVIPIIKRGHFAINIVTVGVPAPGGINFAVPFPNTAPEVFIQIQTGNGILTDQQFITVDPASVTVNGFALVGVNNASNANIAFSWTAIGD